MRGPHLDPEIGAGWDVWRTYEGFHPDGERGPARAEREERAKQICGRCPVLEHCRRHALAVGEPYGVWGGLSMAERSALLHRAPDERFRRWS